MSFQHLCLVASYGICSQDIGVDGQTFLPNNLRFRPVAFLCCILYCVSRVHHLDRRRRKTSKKDVGIPQKNGGCIPTKILIEMRHIVCQPLADIWNSEIIEGKIFSKKLKLGDITPL